MEKCPKMQRPTTFMLCNANVELEWKGKREILLTKNIWETIGYLKGKDSLALGI